MPIHFYYFDDYGLHKESRRKRAEAQVRAKFPDIVEGSRGWYRALANRLRRTP